MSHPPQVAHRFVVLVALLTAAPVSGLHAQFGFLDRIFGKMDNLSVSGGPVWVNGDQGIYDGATPIGLAVKAGIWAGGTGCMNVSVAARKADKCAEDKRRQQANALKRNRCMAIYTKKTRDSTVVKALGVDSTKDPSDEECAQLLGASRDAVEEEVTIPLAAGGTKTTRATLRRPTDTGNNIKYGVTIGYGQVLGLAGSDVGLEYKGGIEELPSIGLNVVFLSTSVSASVGGRLGLNRLLGFRAFLPGPGTPPPTGTTYAGSASALFYGAGVGGSLLLLSGAEILVEASYTFRNFKSIEWGVSGATLPNTIIRRLPLEAFALEFGARVKL